MWQSFYELTDITQKANGFLCFTCIWNDLAGPRMACCLLRQTTCGCSPDRQLVVAVRTDNLWLQSGQTTCGCSPDKTTCGCSPDKTTCGCSPDRQLVAAVRTLSVWWVCLIRRLHKTIARNGHFICHVRLSVCLRGTERFLTLWIFVKFHVSDFG